MADDVVYPWGLISSGNTYTPTSGLPVYFTVRAAADTVYDAVKFLMTGTSMTSFYVAIFKATAANTLTRIRDLGNVKSQLTSATALQIVALPDPLEAEAGEVFVVGLLSVGGTQPTLPRATAVCAADINTGQVPGYGQITAVGAAGSQSSFSSTMSLSSTFAQNLVARIWGALGTQLPPVRPPAYYVDTFNRINSPHLVLPWWPRAGQPDFGIYNDTASPNTGVGMPFNYWVPSIRSNDHYVQARLGADMDVDAGRNVDLYLGLRCGRGGTGQTVKLHVKSDGSEFRIVTVTQPYDNSGLTQRAEPPTLPTPKLGDVIKLVAQGSVYSAFYNDVPITSWIDAGGIQPVDSEHRGVNISTSSVTQPDMQIIDNLEAGDFGGGVQLIGLTGISSEEEWFAPTVVNNTTVVPAAGSLVFTGKAPTLRTGLAIQPPHGNLVFTGKAPAVSVTPHPIQFDAIGPGAVAATNTSADLSLSWTHTAGGTDRIVLVWVSHVTNGTDITTATVKYGTATMTSITLSRMNGNPNRILRLYALKNPPSGDQTVSVTGLHGNGATASVAAGSSISYTGVGDYIFRQAYVAQGSGTNLALSGIASSPNELVVQGFGVDNAVSLTDYNRVQRDTRSATGGGTTRLLIGDTYGLGQPVNFTATAAAAAAWAATAIRLLPAA